MSKYISTNDYMKQVFGRKIYKISINGGFTCPNRDGTLGTEGCIFCSGYGSGDFSEDAALSVTEQIEKAKVRVEAKMPQRNTASDVGRYMAYFQAFTNTYAPVERLRGLYMEEVNHPDIVGISIATRPDCLPDEVIDLLEEINRIKPVWVELGLQTANDETASRINRCYPRSTFENAYCRLKTAGLTVVVHLIFGLPGESEEDMLASVRYLSGLTPPPDGVKLQLLQILRGTRLGEDFTREPWPVMSLSEYAELLVKALRLLPPETVIHRLTGDGPKKLLLAPLWCADKKTVLNTIRKRIAEA